ncbi:serine/threonine protein phosphatase [Dactylosporangium vinaceum]|nr:serine/threonine protein phosphatase [Dactylosporangium vinaceum]
MAARGDADLARLVAAAPVIALGVGGACSVLDIDGAPVFVKRIPLTDRELAHPLSTANLFDLPTYCQYGIYRHPGPGFGAWRELATNEIVTTGVLTGKTEAFPLLYHWRVLPGRPPIAPEHRDTAPAVAQFAGATSVRTRFEELAGASSSLVLFSEYIRDPLPEWLHDPITRAAPFERQLFEITTFLRRHDLLHMDGHFGNLRAEADRVYLVDFGLATSPRFDLSAAERDFVARHAAHDADYAAMWLVNWLVNTVCAVPPTVGFTARDEYIARCATGDIPPDVPAPIAAILRRHAPTAARMNTFCLRLYLNADIHAKYPPAP